MKKHIRKYLPRNHIITGDEYYESDFAYGRLRTVRSIIPFKMKGATIDDVRKKYRMYGLNLIEMDREVRMKQSDISKPFITWPDMVEYMIRHLDKDVLNMFLFNDVRCQDCNGELIWDEKHESVTCERCGRKYKKGDTWTGFKKVHDSLLEAYFLGGINDTPAGAGNIPEQETDKP